MFRGLKKRQSESSEIKYFVSKKIIPAALSVSPATLSHEEQRLLTNIVREGRAVFLPPYDVPNVKNMKKRRNCIFGADQMVKLLLEQLLIHLIRGKTKQGGLCVRAA